MAAGKLTDDERVAHHFSVSQQPFRARVAIPKMTHPHRSVYQNHLHRSDIRLLRAMDFNCLSVPPSFANSLSNVFFVLKR
jgi:hypothetical protein